MVVVVSVLAVVVLVIVVFVCSAVLVGSRVRPNRNSSRKRCSDDVELDEGICGCKL